MRLNPPIALAALLSAALAWACSDDGDEILQADEQEQLSTRTVLVYMVASNSLGSNDFDSDDIAEMEDAMSCYTDGDCRLLLYHVNYDSGPMLTELRSDGLGGCAVDTLVIYDTTTQASLTTDRMSQVIADAAELAPAYDYGLILWSHATGWARSLTKSTATIRDFGQDYGATMQIDSLAYAIPDGMFSFIYTDACYMGAIEVAYQLRDKTRYFIGSPTEIPAFGMPYDQNIPCFFQAEPDLEQACENTYTFYRDLSDYEGLSASAIKYYRSITIALVDCSTLDDLAATCHSIHATARELSSTDSLQHYHISYPHFYYDFKQYTDSISSDSSLTDTFHSLMESAVPYKACTSTLFNSLTIDTAKFSGLSTYVMGTGSDTNEEYYMTLDWYNDVIKQ